jgi:MFS family permease
MPGEAPKVVFWFRVYCGFMTAVYTVMGLASIAFIVFSSKIAEHDKDEVPEAFVIAYGVFLVALGLGLAAAFATPFFVAPKPWVWIYDLLLIAVGMTSCACWPITIPMLIYWIKPETQAHFGRA